MENFFKLKEHGTDVKTEVIAGLDNFHDHGVYPCG